MYSEIVTVTTITTLHSYCEECCIRLCVNCNDVFLIVVSCTALAKTMLSLTYRECNSILALASLITDYLYIVKNTFCTFNGAFNFVFSGQRPQINYKLKFVACSGIYMCTEI